MVMGINLKHTDILPRLKIDGKAVKCINKVVCLRDQFNSAGSNKDLIDDRVKKGRMCTITAMATCSEVTMGVYTIETLQLPSMEQPYETGVKSTKNNTDEVSEKNFPRPVINVQSYHTFRNWDSTDRTGNTYETTQFPLSCPVTRRRRPSQNGVQRTAEV